MPGAAIRITAGPAAWRQRATLIGVNVAISTVLLIGCGLLVRSFVRLLAVEPGFNPQGVLTMEVETSGPTYNSVRGAAGFFDQLAARVAALPGVEAVGASTALPLSGVVDRWGVTVEGRVAENPSAEPSADRFGVGADYFRAMGIPLVRGRLTTEADGAGAPPVVVIGQTMAAQLWPGEDPIGRRITLAGGPGNPPRTIVGIVGDVRHAGLHQPVSLQVYMPQAQSPWPQSNMTLIIRAQPGQDPLALAAAARDQARALDPRQPVTTMATYESIVASSVASREFTLVLIALFAGTALVLAIVGLYGALSYVVSQRQREIGVRVALGAGAPQIRRLVLWQGLRPTVIGLAVGLLGAILAGGTMEALLFDVAPTDALTYAGVIVLMSASAIAACVLPARKAARIEPAVTLRSP